jgi:hypothetical protein
MEGSRKTSPNNFSFLQNNIRFLKINRRKREREIERERERETQRRREIEKEMSKR